MENKRPPLLQIAIFMIVLSVILLLMLYRDPADLAFQRGLKLAEQGDTQAAIQAYTDALQLRPDFAQAYYKRADVYLSLGELETGLNDFQQAAALTPISAPKVNPFVEAYRKQAASEYDAKDYAQSIADYTLILTLIPDGAASAEFYAARGISYADSGDYDHALPDFNKTIALIPDNSLGYISRGNLYYFMRRYDDALQDFAVALEKADEAVTYGNRGLVYKALHEYDKALADFNKAIEMNPNEANFYSNRGNLYQDSGQVDLALNDFNHSIALDPNYPNPYINRSILYREQGNYDLALQDANKSIDLDPRLVKVYTNRSFIFREQGNYDLALQDANKAIELDPKSSEAFIRRGDIYLAMPDIDLALADYNQAVELSPDLADGYYSRGQYYGINHQYDLALSDFSRAVELNPYDALSYDGLGQAYRLTGKFDLALESYNKALEVVLPGNSSLNAKFYSGRGTVYFQQGNLPAALEDFSSALELEPNNADAHLVRGTIYATMGDNAQAGSDFLQWVTGIESDEQLEPSISSGAAVQIEMAQGKVYGIPFSGEAGQHVTIHADAAAGQQVDPLIVLLDSQGEPLAGNDDSQNTANSTIAGYALPETSDYLLIVSHAGGGSEGTINVTLELAP